MQKIIPHIWFNTNAEEAVELYTSVFKNSKQHTVVRYPNAGKEIHGMERGSVMTVEFDIEGFRMIALNGGPHFTLNPSISFMVNFDPSRDADARTRIDKAWSVLSEGGKVLMPLDTYPFSERYGWIQDRFGVSWQLIYTNPEGVERPPIIPSFLFVQQVCGKAEEASDFYMSIFKNAERGTIMRYAAGMEPEKEGNVMFTDFKLEGQWFAAMDSAQQHEFAFNEGISLLVSCRDQEEIDYYWEKLSAVPEAEMCGWIKDRYGVSWQIAPHGMDALLNDPDVEKRERAMALMMSMKKIDIAALKAATE